MPNFECKTWRNVPYPQPANQKSREPRAASREPRPISTNAFDNRHIVADNIHAKLGQRGMRGLCVYKSPAKPATAAATTAATTPTVPLIDVAALALECVELAVGEDCVPVELPPDPPDVEFAAIGET